MLHTRKLSPGFFQNDALGSLSPVVRLLFLGLTTMCDKDGFLLDRPARIKAEILPYDHDIVIDELLHQLLMTPDVDHDFVTRFEHHGVPYLWLPRFTKHNPPSPPTLAPTAESESRAERAEPADQQPIRPTRYQVREYFAELGTPECADHYFDFRTSRDWVKASGEPVGNDWRADCRRWKTREQSYQSAPRQLPPPDNGRQAVSFLPSADIVTALVDAGRLTRD